MTQISTSDRDSHDGEDPAAPVQAVPASQNRGPKDPRPEIRHVAAGLPEDPAQPQLGLLPLSAAFDLLKRSIESLNERQAATAAAGVSARMRQLDPNFSPAAVGFKNFRGFLEAAVERGIIDVQKRPGASDVTISLSGLNRTPHRSERWLRRDLWSALRGRNEGFYVYDRETRRTRRENFEVPIDGRTDVAVPTIPSNELEAWMAEFVAGLPESANRSALEEVVRKPDPVDSFFDAVGGLPGADKRWSHFYRERMSARADAWADKNDIPRAHLRLPVDSTSAYSDGTTSAHQDRNLSASSALAPIDTDARAQVIAAVERMPLADLLRLPIPIEYLLRR